MIIECTIDCLEEKIDSIFEEQDIDCFEVEREEDSLITADCFKVKLPSMGIYMRSGTFFTRYEEDDDFMPDFSITLIYEDDCDQYLYWEQDSFEVTLHNFRTQVKDDKFDGKCIIEIDDESFY